MTRSPIVLLIALLMPGCAPSEEEIQQEFQDFVQSHNACTESAECVVIGPGCPLGCVAYVNSRYETAAQRKADDLIGEYEMWGRQCAYDCAPSGEPTCLEGRCAGAVSE